MSSFAESAPGKIILFGEHAVVYGFPAIAVPVSKVKAHITVSPLPDWKPGNARIIAPQLDLDSELRNLSPSHFLNITIQNVFEKLNINDFPPFLLEIQSTIPVAAGLGSGAAVSVAIIRALAAFSGRKLSNEEVSHLTYEIEKIHHGTPSGIDNTVITYNLPVFFIRNQPIQTIDVPVSFTLIIADTGISSPTALTVASVRKAWQADKSNYEKIFSEIGAISKQAKDEIEKGMPTKIGPLMTENHFWLSKLGTSSPELDILVRSALEAGALGAKLSGGGRGGNMIALVTNDEVDEVESALRKSGSVRTIITEVVSRERIQ
jgi:mevalonate kinase